MYPRRHAVLEFPFLNALNRHALVLQSRREAQVLRAVRLPQDSVDDYTHLDSGRADELIPLRRLLSEINAGRLRDLLATYAMHHAPRPPRYPQLGARLESSRRQRGSS